MNRPDSLFESVLDRNKVYAGKYMDLERLTIQLPDGKTGTREIVRVRNAVAVLPIDKKGNAHLVRQHRLAIGRTIIEIPAGIIDDGEQARLAAARECKEETGYEPNLLLELIAYAHAEGYSTGFITLFLGLDCEETGNTDLDVTEFVEPVCMPFKELLHKVESNEFIDSKTILSTLLSAPTVSHMFS